MTRAVDREVLVGLIEEIGGYLPAMREALAAAVDAAQPAAALEPAYRLAHTIRGAAAMVGLFPLAWLGSLQESLLDELAAGARPLDAPAVACLETFCNTIENHLVGLLDESADADALIVESVAVDRRYRGLDPAGDADAVEEVRRLLQAGALPTPSSLRPEAYEQDDDEPTLMDAAPTFGADFFSDGAAPEVDDADGGATVGLKPAADTPPERLAAFQAAAVEAVGVLRRDLGRLRENPADLETLPSLLEAVRAL
ncbi:MAG: Hpt domain-containing protein, partial [Planctomycetia bacterium]